jgi:hypothetical protein
MELTESNKPCKTSKNTTATQFDVSFEIYNKKCQKIEKKKKYSKLFYT